MSAEKVLPISPQAGDASSRFLDTFDGEPEKFYEQLGAQRHEGRLSNGLKVVHIQRPGTKVALLLSTVGGGRYDEGRLQGRAHFNEHMMTSGTDRYPRPEELAEIIENAGGYFNAHTSEEDMAVDIRMSDTSDFALAMDIASECFTKAIYDPNTMKTERSAILQEISTDDSDLESRVWTEYQRVFFPGTPLETPVLGTRKTVKAMTRDDLLGHSQEMFVTERMVLVVAGNLPFERVMAQANASFGNVSRGQRIREADTLAETMQDGGIAICRFPGEERVAFNLGFRTRLTEDIDSAALDVLADILGGGSASLLMKRLRFDKGTGLVYGAGAANIEHSDAGALIINCSTTKDQMQRVFNIITDLLKNIRDNGLSEEEIAAAKNKLLKMTLGGMETTAAWAGTHSSSETSALRKDPTTISDGLTYPLYGYARDIARVSPEDVKRVAQEHFTPEKLRFAICGDITKKDIKLNF